METLNLILNYTILGNELWRFIFVLFALILAPLIAKLFNYILNNFLKKWADKTDVQFDDILFNSLNPSMTMFVFAAMFYIGTQQLNQGAYTGVFTSIFNLLLIIPVVYFLIKFSTEAIAFYLKGDKESMKKRKVNEAAIDLLMSIIRIALFIIGILLVISNLGYNVTALLTGLGVGGLAFALAAQDILKNFFAGIALIFDKTFGKGEKVNFEGYAGTIEELKLRSTKLRTYDGTLLTIPNAKLADNIVENVTKVPRVKVKMTLGLVYSTPSKKVKQAKAIIQKVLDAHPDVDETSTTIFFNHFGAYSLDIDIYYYAKKLTMANWKERTQMKDDVNIGIMDGFEKAKIDFAFPTQTIELKKE
jgi:MscS family membrane protein